LVDKVARVVKILSLDVLKGKLLQLACNKFEAEPVLLDNMMEIGFFRLLLFLGVIPASSYGLVETIIYRLIQGWALKVEG
jgi:hypothetical protein